MADKITYILGAGASYNAFPVVKDIKWNGQLVKPGLAQALIDTGISLRQFRNENTISNYLITVGEESMKFGNVDSYAKYLYHKGEHQKLEDLKLALTYFFMENQIPKETKKTDNRYLNFITSIVDENNQFPENVKVLTWNYDYLLEETCDLYNHTPERLFTNGQQFKQIPSFAPYFPGTIIKHHVFDYSIVHLNGICGFFYIDGNFPSIFNDAKSRMDGYDKNTLLDAFEQQYCRETQLMTFAWEKNSQTNSLLLQSHEITQRIIKETTILVVIGYSFPFYNREVDKMIFENIRPSLRKIYYQDPFIDGEFLKTRYDLEKKTELYTDEAGNRTSERIIINNVDVIHVKEVDQFFIPVEL